MSHTPGPWGVGRMLEPKNAPAIIGDGDSVVAILPGEWNHCSYIKDDAHLIAASPTMYEYIAKRAAGGDDEAASIIGGIHA